VIASFLNANEAHIFRGLLESEGIDLLFIMNTLL